MVWGDGISWRVVERGGGGAVAVAGEEGGKWENGEW